MKAVPQKRKDEVGVPVAGASCNNTIEEIGMVLGQCIPLSTTCGTA
jgi:hypothetical protein